MDKASGAISVLDSLQNSRDFKTNQTRIPFLIHTSNKVLSQERERGKLRCVEMAASNGSEFFGMEIGEPSEMLRRPSNASSVAEDEEELRWAAIERLPSVKRVNMAFVKRSASSSSGIEPIDVRNLDRFKRELVVKNAYATNEQDNYRLLSAIKERLDKYERNHCAFSFFFFVLKSSM